MLTRLFESVLVNAINGVAARRDRLNPAAASEPDEDAADRILVGHELLPEPHACTAASSWSTRNWQLGEPVYLDPAERLRHVYVLGATGVGKTRHILRLIESDLAARRALCVVDLRGDLVELLLHRLAARPDLDAASNLLVLDLGDTGHSVGFNPLAGPQQPFARAFHALSVLKGQADSWGVQLDETLRNCLLALAETDWTLLEVEPLLTAAAFRAHVLAAVTDRQVRAFFSRYDALSEDKKTDWRLPVFNKISPFTAVPSMRRMLGQRTPLPLPELLERPGQVVLLSLDVAELHAAAHLAGAFFLSAIQNAAMGRISAGERPAMHLYVDEFETMATERFGEIIAEGRRFGLGLCLSHQNLSQVPAGLSDVIRNNAFAQFLFQTGAVDARELAREVVSDMPQDDVRRTLMSLGVGEAFLLRRGHLAVPVRIPRSREVAADADLLDALRAAARTAYGRPAGEVDRELEERAAWIESLKGGKPAGYEVRHDRTAGRFRPGAPKDVR
jgi:hypothetical protein